MSIENLREQDPMFGLPFAKVKSLVIQSPIFGAEGEPDLNADPDDDPDEKPENDPEKGKPEVKSEDDKTKNELIAAKKQLEEKDAELKAFKDKEEAEARKKRTDDENNKKDLETANAKIAEMTSDGEALLDTVHNLVLENAIALGDTKWHDVGYVLREIDFDAIEINVDKETRRGTVTGLDKELERIAKDKPFLVKSVEKEEPEIPKTPRRRGSGAPPGSGNGAGGEKAKARDRLMGLYPSLAH